MQSFQASGESVSFDQEVFCDGLDRFLGPIFQSHLTCCGIQHLGLLIAAKDSFREKCRKKNMWKEKTEKKSSTRVT